MGTRLILIRMLRDRRSASSRGVGTENATAYGQRVGLLCGGAVVGGSLVVVSFLVVASVAETKFVKDCVTDAETLRSTSTVLVGSISEDLEIGSESEGDAVRFLYPVAVAASISVRDVEAVSRDLTEAEMVAVSVVIVHFTPACS